MVKHHLKEKFIALRSQNYPLSEISALIGVARRTLYNWEKEFSSVICRAKDKHLAEISEKFAKSDTIRYENLMKQYDKVVSKLDSCKNHFLTYESMVALLIKLTNALENYENNFRTKNCLKSAGNGYTFAKSQSVSK